MEQLNLVLNAVVNDKPTAALNESIKALSQHKGLQKLQLDVGIDSKDLSKIAKAIGDFQKTIQKTGYEDRIFDFDKLEKKGAKTFANLGAMMAHFSKLGNIRIPEKTFDPITKKMTELTMLVDKGNGHIDKMRVNLVRLQKDGQDIKPRLMVTSLQELKPTDNIAEQKMQYDKITSSLTNIYSLKTKLLNSDENLSLELNKQLVAEQAIFAQLQKEKVEKNLTNDAQQKELAATAQQLSAKYTAKVADKKDQEQAQHIRDVNEAYKNQAGIIESIHNLDKKILQTDKDDLATLRELKDQRDRLYGNRVDTYSVMEHDGLTDQVKDIELLDLEFRKREEIRLVIAKTNDAKVNQSKAEQQKQWYGQQEDSVKRIHALEKQWLDAKIKGQTEFQKALEEEMLYEKSRADSAKGQIAMQGLRDKKEEKELTDLIRNNEAEIEMIKKRQLDISTKDAQMTELAYQKKYGQVDASIGFIKGSDDNALRDYRKEAERLGTVIKYELTQGFDKSGKSVNTYTAHIRTADDHVKKLSLTSVEAENSVRRLESELGKTPPKDKGILGMLGTAMEKYPIWIAATAAWQGLITQVRNGVSYIVDMDTALTSLMKVTDMTKEQFEGLRETAIELGKELGKSSVEIMNSFAEIGRAYKDPKEITEMARISTMASNVTSLTAQEAAKDIQTMLLTYKLGVQDAAGVLDTLNEIKFVSPYTVMYM